MADVKHRAYSEFLLDEGDLSDHDFHQAALFLQRLIFGPGHDYHSQMDRLKKIQKAVTIARKAVSQHKPEDVPDAEDDA